MRTILMLAAAVTVSGCAQFDQLQAKRLATSELAGSGQAQFRDLVARDGKVCGQIRVTDALGVASEFKGFIADLEAGTVIVEPSLASDASMTPFQQAFVQLDQDMSLLDFSAASYQACGHSVASAEADNAKEALTRHFGMAVVPRIGEAGL